MGWISLYLISEEKLVNSVRVAFNAIHCCLKRVNIPKAEDTAIARRTERSYIFFIDYLSCSILDLSGKELVESSERINVRNLDLIEIDPVEFSESQVHVLTEIRR